jgi:hypothetical protein
LNLFSESRSSDGSIFFAPESMTSPKLSSSSSIADFGFVAEEAIPDSRW